MRVISNAYGSVGFDFNKQNLLWRITSTNAIENKKEKQGDTFGKENGGKKHRRSVIENLDEI